MSTEQIVAAALAVAAVISGGTYGSVRISKRRPAVESSETVDVLLGRISELEASLTAERTKTAELEAQVTRLREERRELASRVSHLEGQVKTLSELVSKLVERQ